MIPELLPVRLGIRFLQSASSMGFRRVQYRELFCHAGKRSSGNNLTRFTASGFSSTHKLAAYADSDRHFRMCG